VIFGALQVTKVLSTEEAKRAIEGSGKDFGKSGVTLASDSTSICFIGSVYMRARVTLGVGLPYQTDMVTLATGLSFCLHKPCKRVR
jgi:hypothetical protein